MIRIISNNGKTNIGGWHDSFHTVKIFNACRALNSLYGKNSHSLDFSDSYGGINDYVLNLLIPVLKEKEMEMVKTNSYADILGFIPNRALKFTGFHKLMVGGYEYDFMGHSFVQVEFKEIIEHMLAVGE